MRIRANVCRRLARLVVLVVVPLAPAVAGAQEAEPNPLLESLGDQAEEARALPIRAAFLSTRAARSEARGINGVHAFVRANIGLEPYSGRVRGARGTLFSRSGNSLDIALLVGALLEEQGINWRLARANLDIAETRALVGMLTPSGALAGAEVNDAYDPTGERWIQRHLQDHWWVEAEADGSWTPVDPIYPGLAPGQSVAEPDDRLSAADMTERLAHRATFRVAYRRGMRAPVTVLSFEADLVDLAYRNLVLSFTGEGSRQVRAALDAGGEIVRGESFDRDDAEQIWLELEFGAGESGYRIERDLRRAGDGLDLFANGVQVYSILFLPGWVGTDYYRAVAGALMAELVEDVSALLAAAESVDPEASARVPASLQARLVDVLAPMTGLIALSFAQASDEMVLGLGAQSGVRPFYAKPRVLVAGAARLTSGLAFQLDLRDNQIDVVPWAGLPPRLALGFHVLRGRLDAELTGDVLAALTALPTLSASGLLSQAWDEERRFTSISATNLGALDRLSVSDASRSRIEADASTGGVVLTPLAPLRYGGSERMAWWRLQSSSGQVYGVLDDGVRDAVAGLLAGSAAGSPAVEGAPALVAEVSAAAEALFSGTLDQARHGRHARDQACVVACDVQRLADAACGDPAAASLERCLSAPRVSEDPLGLGLACADMVDAFRCGSWIGRALVDGRIAVEVTDGEVFWGPWDAPIEPVHGPSRCRCE